ncbi:MAG: 4'-phosphopantetheinyl transferase superfamily protein [Burkholderiales bacterium]|nr:4'-phosphopantetheinyl transferase superfamily protein [Burkholderiales bacterium]
MAEAAARCGIDTVEIARIERLLAGTPPADLRGIFSDAELADSGDGPGRAASLAARFAAKEACLKLFPRETALGALTASDFAVERDSYGAPRVACSGAAQAVLDRHRIGAIALSLTHDRTSASAVALAEPAVTPVPLAGRLLYRLLPIRRRVVRENLRRVYGETAPEAEIERIAQAHYAHLARLAAEFVAYPWRSPERRAALARVENLETIVGAHARGKGVIVITGHFGNFEVATAAAISSFPEAKGRFWFVRRPFKPQWLDAIIIRRFRAAGFGVLPKSGSLDAILERLAAGDIVVFPFDQHAGPRDGVRVAFFGHPAGTFRSVALIALASGAPVLPGASWRAPDGCHVLRFEAPLELVHCDDVGEEIRRNTRLFNASLERLVLRHPEQWWWVHRRWKPWPEKKARANAAAKREPGE